MSMILRVWKQQPGRFFCISTKDRSGTWKDTFFKTSRFNEVQPFIDRNMDKDLYWCLHGFSKPRRLKKYAELPKLLYADLDEVDPRKLGTLTPSIAWESSPGRYACLWVLNDFGSEDVNRRLTYHLKADPGGWDLTQVLRLPGTTNFKYVSTPKVKLLWQDGNSYNLKDIEKQLPHQAGSKKETDVARGLYTKYERKMSAWARRQLFKGKPKEGKRSEVLWRLTNELLEAGCTRDEAFELLRVSPWNKFKKRRDGDEQLRRELDKAVGQHIHVENDEKPQEERFDDGEDVEDDDEEYRYLARSMAEVEEENMDWIWYPYLARGEVTILEGDPGLGKSYLAQMVAKHICDGESLPTTKRGQPVVTGKVAYFDMENSQGSVTKKRLTGNGAKRLDNFFQEPEPFSIDDDEEMDRVYEAVDKLRPTLVVFDTINTYMGSADTHKASETQQTFKRFVDIARRFKCSVLVLRHLTKSTKEKALYRGQGSIAFVGLARVVMMVGQSPDDEDTRVVAVTKINVVRPPRALTFKIESLPDTLKQTDRSKFEWGGFVDLSADDIIAKPKEQSKQDLTRAIDWLKEMLEGHKYVDWAAISRSAGSRSISDKEIQLAAKELGIEKRGEGTKMQWRWPRAEEKKN